MKRFLLWSFERGSIQYDVICVLILSFIFLTPPSAFNDRPDFMRVEDEAVRQTKDDDGNTVFVVKVNTPTFKADRAAEKVAVEQLSEFMRRKFEISRMEPIYSATGTLVAFSIWVDPGVEPF